MKERPILFSAPMVRAILEGRKTMTRRVMQPQPPFTSANHTYANLAYAGKCPYGVPGDRLWVRETWCCTNGLPGPPSAEDVVLYRADEGDSQRIISEINGWNPSIHMPLVYSRITLEITDVRVERVQDISEEDAKAEGVESPEIEREVHDFAICPECGGTRLYTAHSMAGACFDVDCMKCDTYAKRFHHLWDSINAKRDHGWDVNDWVWALTFRIV